MDSEVGYTGGATGAPTYESVCSGDGHTEALRLEFDPSVTSYEDIIREFYEDPHVGNQFCSDDSGGGRSAMETAQYRTAIWAQDEAQRQTALRVAADVGKEVPVLTKSVWHRAEGYHQHWMDPEAVPHHWKRSTEAAARRPAANAWVMGHDPWTKELLGALDADAR